MKATISVTSGPYGFGKTWSLVLTGKSATKSFFLGQDAKVCHRLLQMEPRHVCQAIGTNVLDDKGCKKLARFILEHLNDHHMLNARKIMKMDTWELSVE